MESVGINGVIVDWYGTSNKNDFSFIKESTDILWNEIQTNHPSLYLVICYDMSQYNAAPTQQELLNSLEYLVSDYFPKSQYLKHSNNPIMFIWPNYDASSFMTQSAWNQLKQEANINNLLIFTEYDNPAWLDNSGNYYGMFLWVYPQNAPSNENSQIMFVENYFNQYYASQINLSPLMVTSIFRGFNDHYIAGGTGTTNPYNAIGLLNPDYGYINITYNYTIYDLNSKYNIIPNIIQIPTWNDYTEGTMIEPSYPTYGCIEGCNIDETNPYEDLLNIYLKIGDGSQNWNQKLQQLEAITHDYFPNL